MSDTVLNISIQLIILVRIVIVQCLINIVFFQSQGNLLFFMVYLSMEKYCENKILNHILISNLFVLDD